LVASISSQDLFSRLDPVERPLIVDVRREAAWRDSAIVLPWSLRRDPERIAEWQGALELGRPVVVYCVHGHEVSRNAAAALAAAGYRACHLEGGIAAWQEAGLPLAERVDAPSLWVTRERPKIDRIACPWLIRRFVDADARFLFVPPAQVLDTARESGATPFDVPDVAFSHDGERCSFDAFILRYGLDDAALAELAPIVRGADTGRMDLAPQAAGLLAVSLGLSARFADDHEALRYGLIVYDALYAWLRKARAESHGWPPAAMPTDAGRARAS
jgi:rhodanese-related sulfurtransferase